MSDVISDPETAPVGVSHRSPRSTSPSWTTSTWGSIGTRTNGGRWWRSLIGLAASFVALWLARPFIGNILSFLPAPILGFLDKWLDPTRLGLVLLIVLALTAVFDLRSASGPVPGSLSRRPSK